MVTIQRTTYEDLLRRSRELAALDAYGVDNWEGYSDAMQSLGENEDE